jgi:hypothetical protein
VTDQDAVIERILTSYDTTTVVGASAAAFKAAHTVAAHMQRHGWRIIPVNPHADDILGEPVYRRLGNVPGRWAWSTCSGLLGRRRTSRGRPSRRGPPPKAPDCSSWRTAA